MKKPRAEMITSGEMVVENRFERKNKHLLNICSLNCRAFPHQKCIERHKLERKLNYQAFSCVFKHKIENLAQVKKRP